MKQTFENRLKYFGTAGIIVLLLVIGEFVLGESVVSPDTLTLLLFPEWKPFAISLMVLFALSIVGTILWTGYILNQALPSTYGTAHFASKKEVHLAGASTQESGSSFTLGIYRNQRIALSKEQQEGHVMIIAPTKRGKTAGIIIPNLLQERGSRSLFVNDIKHELIDLCIEAVAKHHNCYNISPTRPEESDGYNPLAHVNPHSLSDARSVAECIVKNTGSSKEPFWDNSARLLITATILHIRATEPDAPFNRVADICTKSLSEISEIITNSPSSLAQRVGASFVKNVAAEPRLQSNIMTDIATRFFDTMDPGIESVTAHDDLDFQQLADTPSALFLHIPPHDATRLRWLSSCLIMQLINYLFGHPHKQQFAFYLDELANVGYIPNYLEYISYIRSAGVAFLQVIQDFGQLERIYEEAGKDTILANSGTQIFLSGVGQVEAEYASRVIGDTTVLARSESTEHKNVTYSETARKLMHPNEIRSLPLWQLLVLMGNTPPILVKNTPYFRVPEMVALTHLPYIRPTRERPLAAKLPTASPLSVPLSQPPIPKEPPPQHKDDDEHFMGPVTPDDHVE